MNRVVVAGVLLWVAALATSGVVVAGTVSSDDVDSTVENVTRTVENGTVTVAGVGGDVWVRMSNESVSARARTGETTVGLEELGTENASGSLASPALGDGTDDSLRTGLCAAGLDGADSPLGFTVDGEEERVSVAFREYTEPEPREASAGEIVASCTG